MQQEKNGFEIFSKAILCCFSLLNGTTKGEKGQTENQTNRQQHEILQNARRNSCWRTQKKLKIVAGN
jgi:hypothetical protein